MKGLIARSINNNEKIIIFYLDSNGKVKQRFVRVLKMHDSHILVYCYYRKRVRTFNLNNIFSAGPIRERGGA